MMRIELRNVTPENIEKEKWENSEIWHKTLTIEKGEHLHVVAPSGSGKTTLIHFIYGLRKDYSGTIFYDSTNTGKLCTEGFSAFRKNKISIIFQDLRLFENQTVKENIEIKRILDPFHKPEAIIEMTKRLGIENKLNQMVALMRE